MLQAMLAEFRAWGMAHTTTTLDARLSGARLAADQVILLQPERHRDTLLELASHCDAALIIAPESDGVLGRISGWLEAAGVMLLGASTAAVAVAADKWLSYQLFRQNAIPVPDTRLVNPRDGLKSAKSPRLPLVIKPRQGAGAEGVRLVADLASLPQEMAQTQACAGQCLVQAFVPGVHASVSLLSNGRQAIPLSLNSQRIQVGAPFVYQGGSIPLKHPLKERAFALAQQAARLVPGLRGYVGVDLVLAPEQCYVIEINARITTSFVGLRKIINLNLAQAIWQACQSGYLPTEVALTGSISFGKEGVHG